MRRTGNAREPLWFKDAIIYELPVKSFCDGNGDGIGDFPGLCEKLIIPEPGVTPGCCPSSLAAQRRRHDIADYVNVHPLRTLDHDFWRFLGRRAPAGLRKIEMVLNHT